MFQSLALHDTLTFTPSAVRSRSPATIRAVRPIEDNLVWRAADGCGGPAGAAATAVWRSRVTFASGFRCKPDSAAAAATRPPRFARWPPSGASVARRSCCTRIARDLGADVPFFFEGGTVLGVDRGDVLYPLVDRPSVVGRARVSRISASARAMRTAGGMSGPREQTPKPETGNDLQAPVAARHPEIAANCRPAASRWAQPTPRCRGAARRCSVCLRATKGPGSGAAVSAQSGARVVVTETLTRRRYRTFSRPRLTGATSPAVRTSDAGETCGLRSPSYRLTVCTRVVRPLLRAVSPALIGARNRHGGAWPSGKARDFGSRIRRFESFRPSQTCAKAVGDW